MSIPAWIQGTDRFGLVSRFPIILEGPTEAKKTTLERSVFYDRKKEAIYIFSVCLFG